MLHSTRQVDIPACNRNGKKASPETEERSNHFLHTQQFLSNAKLTLLLDDLPSYREYSSCCPCRRPSPSTRPPDSVSHPPPPLPPPPPPPPGRLRHAEAMARRRGGARCNRALAHAGAVRDAGGQSNRKSFSLSFGLKDHLKLGFRFPTLRKSSNIMLVQREASG